MKNIDMEAQAINRRFPHGSAGRSGSQSGFTLIEVMIAMLILSLGLLSVASAFAQGMLILVNTPTQLAAKELAYAIVDDIIVRYDAGIDNLAQTTVCSIPESCMWNGRTFSVDSITLVPPDPTAADPEIDVTVTVTWTGSVGNRSYTTPTVNIKRLSN